METITISKQEYINLLRDKVTLLENIGVTETIYGILGKIKELEKEEVEIKGSIHLNISEEARKFYKGQMLKQEPTYIPIPPSKIKR